MTASYAIDGSECKRDEPEPVSPLAPEDCNDPWMPEKALTVLAANLRAIFDERDKRTGKKRQSVQDIATKTGLPVRSLYRWMNAENAPLLDQLDDLAKGLRVQPWELITPKMSRPLSEEAWLLTQQLDALPDEDRARVYSVVEFVLAGRLPPPDSQTAAAAPAAEPAPAAPSPAPKTKRAKTR